MSGSLRDTPDGKMTNWQLAIGWFRGSKSDAHGAYLILEGKTFPTWSEIALRFCSKSFLGAPYTWRTKCPPRCLPGKFMAEPHGAVLLSLRSKRNAKGLRLYRKIKTTRCRSDFRSESGEYSEPLRDNGFAPYIINIRMTRCHSDISLQIWKKRLFPV